jgi:hypothetical protein
MSSLGWPGRSQQSPPAKRMSRACYALLAALPAARSPTNFRYSRPPPRPLPGRSSFFRFSGGFRHRLMSNDPPGRKGRNIEKFIAGSSDAGWTLDGLGGLDVESAPRATDGRPDAFSETMQAKDNGKDFCPRALRMRAWIE